ncbi:MAG TPA: L-threonylcarbamoyladenylate synthase [Anaerolineaceae bacterium]|nr:L-threonylcarbamoyladenylate synthase [Anaerolineaceae bacterium]
MTDPTAKDRAIKTIRQGGLVVFPTDTVYGVAADVRSSAAIERLFEAKGRDASKAIPVLLGAPEQLDQVSPGAGEMAYRLARFFWPGPLTLVIPRNEDLPQVLSPGPTVGVRMPDHEFTLSLLRSVGPLATTSANRSSEPNPLTAQDALEQLKGRVELVIDGGPCPGGLPSTVVDCTGEEPVILRPGPISLEDLLSSLG